MRYFVTYFSNSVTSVCLSNFSLTVNIIYKEMKESVKLTPSIINIMNVKCSLPITKCWCFDGCYKHTQLKICSVTQEHGCEWNEYGTFL